MTQSSSGPTILVDQAEHTVGVGVLRSLGRAGYRTIATSPCANAIGFRSRYAQTCLVSPSPFERQRYLDWLDDTIERYRVGMLIATEGLLTAIAPRYERYHHLLPYASAQSLYGAINKADVMARFGDRDPGLARHVLVDSAQPTRSLDALPRPLFLKGDHLHATDGDESVVRRVDEPDIGPALAEFRRRFRKFVVQGYEPGVGTGACFVRWDGRIIARLLHRRLHEVPPSGGVSSLRETFWHPGIAADAEQRLDALDWQGPIMFEYRWDPKTDAFRLIEINARFWGSIHLGIYAGVDFPRLLVEAMSGARPTPVLDYPLGLRARETVPGELDYLRLRLGDSSLSAWSRVRTAAGFLRDTLDPRVRSDMAFPRDRGLAWHRAVAELRERAGRLKRWADA